ncbi:MAG TPA: RHS repeat-associated core domain-containing protein [Pantanalinema sp.]
MRRSMPGTRLISATLAMLMVLYSLPPRAEGPASLPFVPSPSPDYGMILHSRLDRLNLPGPLGEFKHQLWHLTAGLQDVLTKWARLSPATTPLARAHHNYEHQAVDKTTSNFVFRSGTTFFEPDGTPPRDGNNEYEYVTTFGWKTKGKAPAQRSPHTLTLPLVNDDGRDPKDVEYHNSYFSEHEESSGFRLFVADFLNDSNGQYPRLLGENRDRRSIFIEQADKGWFSGYKNEWKDWHSGDSFTGSGYGNFGWPKWFYSGIKLTLKQHPYWAFSNYESSLNHIKTYAFDSIIKRKESIYYWETNPHLVNKLREEVAKLPDNSFRRGRPTRINGFWVEVQPFPTGAFHGPSDYPLTDFGGATIAFSTPFAGLRGEPKFSKLKFYRPYAPDQHGEAGIGFLSGADAAVNPDEHDPIADYACVGAFAAYDRSDSDIAKAIDADRANIWKDQQTTGAVTGLKPKDPKEAANLKAGLLQLPETVLEQVIQAVNAGGESAELAKQLVLDVYADGVEQGIIKNTFTTSNDPTNPSSEPNATTKPPALFSSTFQVDPVDVVSGANYHDHYDLQLKGRGMRTDFLRSYNSSFKPDDSNRGFMPLGHGWTHTYNQYLFRFPDNAIAYYNDHGQSTIFMPAGNGYRAPPGTGLSLSQLADGSYQVRDKEGATFDFSGGLKRIATERKFFYEPGIEPFGTTQPIDAGRLQGFADRNGNRFELAYTSGKLTQVTDPSSRHLRFTYQGDRIATMVDPAGRTFSYRYEGDNLVEVIHPGSAHQVYTYAGHMMTGHSDRDPEQMWRFAYDAQGKVIQATDPEGGRTEFVYSPGKTVQTAHEVDGRTFRTEYDINNGDIVRQKDPSGTVFDYAYENHRKVRESFSRGDRQIVLTYGYDDRGNMTRKVDASGQETTIKYDPQFSQPYEVKDPSGVTTITLDAQGNVRSIRDPAGRTVAYTVDDHGQTQAVVDPGQHRTTTEHNAFGLLTHVDTPIGGWTTYAYDALGQVTGVTDPTGTRRYEYDARGHLHTYTDQLGQITLFEADANGNVTRITAPGGRVTQMGYDKKNQLVYTRDNAGAETRYSYNSLGQLWKVTDGNGHLTQFERDGNGRVTRIVDPTQRAKAFTYDAAGNVTQMANELGEITRYAYDPLNRVSLVTDPEGQASAIEYHWIGAIKRITNPRQFSTQFVVNAVGQITDVVPPAPEGPTHYRYGADGTLLQIERPKGQTQQFTYNAAGQILTVTDTRKTTRYAYDALGRLTEITAPDGRRQSFQQDALGRIKTVVDALGNPTEFDYWPSGELKSIRKVNGGVTDYSYDAAGRVSRISAPEGRVTQLRYDNAGNLLEKISPSGAETDYVYDSLNRLSEVSELSKGAKTSYGYDPAGRMTSITDANGQATSIFYDRLGRPVRVNAPLQQRMEFQYDPAGNLLRRTDANGRSTTYAYDANNRLTKVTDPLLRATLFAYDELGNMTSTRRLADGATTTISYNDLNLPEEVIDALQGRTRMQYDAFGNLTASIDAKNRTTRYQYDALNRVTAVSQPMGKTTQLAYDRMGNLDRVTNALGVTTRNAYDAADRLRFVYEPLGRTTEYRYNALAQVTLVRDANGNQVSVNYDKMGRPIRRMNGNGYSTDFFYDRLDRLTRKTDAQGQSTQYAYDELSRLTRVTDALGNQTRYQYDPIGNMTALQDARGKQWAFHYDELNRLDWERDPLQRMSQYVYDSVGNLDKKRDGNGAWTDYQYDKLGRVSKVQTPDDLASFTYDEVGNMTGYQNRHANVQRRFDDLDRLTEESNVTWAKTTRFAYDAVDRMTALTTPQGRTVRYDYDDLNQMRAMIDPEGNRTSYQYDRGGRLTGMEYPSGNRSAYVYDPANQTKSLTHYGRGGQGLQGFAYEYDRVGNRTQTRELDGSLTQYRYDALSRLEDVTYPVQAILADRDFTLASAQQGNGAKGNGQQASSAEDEKEKGPKLLSIKDSGLGSSKFTILSVRSIAANGNSGQGNGNGNGNGQSSSGNGNGNSNGQDSSGNGNGNGKPDDNNPGNGNSGNGQGNGNSGNGQGNGNSGNGQGNGNSGNGQGNGNGKQADKDKGEHGKPQKEKLGKAKSKNAKRGSSNGKNQTNVEAPAYWFDPVSSVRYTYDQVGNRLTETTQTGTLAYSYDDANQLKRVGETTYEYDGNGNRVAETTEGSSVRYQYDALNQLAGVRYADGGQLKYTYDPMGRLIQGDRPDVEQPQRQLSTRYSYAGNTLLGEFTETGAPLAEYYSGNGEAVTRRMFGNHGRLDQAFKLQTKGNHLYYLHDALGSVTGMTDHQGSRILRYRQDVFGTPQAGLLDPYNTQLLTAKSYDTEAGLYYFGSRWYDPATGRFMNQDSYRGTPADPMSLHRYAYVNNNPATLIDAWGFQAEWKPQSSNNFFDKVTERIGGALNGVSSMVGGAIDAVKSDPWKALAVGAGVVAVIGASALFPAAAPALLSIAQSAATNYIVGQGVSLATGIVKDAASSISPQLGGALEWVEKGVNVYNAISSVASGAGGLGALNVGNLTSLVSFDTANSLSAVTGGLSTISNSFGVEIPGLDKTNEYLGYAKIAGQFANSYQQNEALITERKMWEKHGNKVAYAGEEYAHRAQDYWAQKSLSGNLVERAAGNVGLALSSLVQDDESLLSTALALTPGSVFEAAGAGVAAVGSQVAERFGFSALKSAASQAGKTVLGHYPEYMELAENIGARAFEIPADVWNRMSKAEQWTANQKFLDRMISRGDDILLATPLNKVKPGSYFARELEYLSGKGYKPNADGSRLVRGN